MKYKSEQLEKQLFPLIGPGKHYILSHPRPDFSKVGNKQLENALYGARNLLGATMRAALQIHSVYGDTVICHKMIGSFPWKRRGISRAHHLRFVWGQFTNLCYQFQERYKLFMNLQHRTMATFKQKKTGSISDGLKRIRKVLGPHIRERGQNTHEWSKSNPHAEHFETIEFINSVEPQPAGPLGNVVGQFRITRMLMRWEIETTIKFMEEMLLDTFEQQIPPLAKTATMFNELIELSKTHQAVIKDGEITATRQ